MKTTMNHRKGSAQIIIIAIVVIAVLVGLYFFFSNNAGNAPTGYAPSGGTSPTAVNTAPVINNDQGLTAASQNLDSADLTQLDSGISQNASDAQTFAPRIRLKNGSSLNWSGYAVETNLASPQSNAVSDAKGSWTVPAVSCGKTTTYSAAWVGIDGYSDNTVEQLGTAQDCIKGKPRYSAWYEMYPQASFAIKYPVAPGDAVSAEVNYLGSNSFQLTLTDVTKGWNFTTTQSANASRESAEWIMEAPSSGRVLPLANFGTINFSNAQATVNGVTGTINNGAWQNDAITMTDSAGNVKALPSALSPDGSGFGVTWKSSN